MENNIDNKAHQRRAVRVSEMSSDIEAADRHTLEIMAPAGNFECLHAAIQGGADSVYFGVEKLNMRYNRTTGGSVACTRTAIYVKQHIPF